MPDSDTKVMSGDGGVGDPAADGNLEAGGCIQNPDMQVRSSHTQVKYPDLPLAGM